jgi:hypothetical protein
MQLTTRSVLDNRAALLGAGGSWQQSFQNGIVVLAPLLTALIGTALPK